MVLEHRYLSGFCLLGYLTNCCMYMHVYIQELKAIFCRVLINLIQNYNAGAGNFLTKIKAIIKLNNEKKL